MLWLMIIVGAITAFNLIVLKMKFERQRYADVLLDLAAMIVLNIMFGMTLGGMVVAMTASFIISIWLFYNPPMFSRDY